MSIECHRPGSVAHLSMASDSLIVVLSEGAEDLLQDPVEAKKALETIDIRVTNRPISLLQHKLYNVWIAFAQSTANAADTRIFEFPLSEVMEVCGFDSHNTEYFVDAAKQIFDLRVEYNSLGRQIAIAETKSAGKGTRGSRGPTKWAAAQLISFIEIDSSINRMRVEFPEVIRQEILRPDHYRSIDLHVQAQFSSRAGLSLYEYVLRYASDEATPWLPWETYSMLLSGSAEPHRTMRDFSKMLKRAIEQVNAHHESHQIHAEFTKRGKAFHRMRVVIKLRHQAQLPFQSRESLPSDILEALRKMGLKEREVDLIAKAHPLEYLKAHVAYVQRRFSDRTQERVKVPAAYLRAALLGNYAGYSSNAPPVPQVAAIPVSNPAASERASQLPQPRHQTGREGQDDAIRKWYGNLEEARRSELARQFYDSVPPLIRRMIERSGMESRAASAAFDGWLREQGHYVDAT